MIKSHENRWKISLIRCQPHQWQRENPLKSALNIKDKSFRNLQLLIAILADLIDAVITNLFVAFSFKKVIHSTLSTCLLSLACITPQTLSNILGLRLCSHCSVFTFIRLHFDSFYFLLFNTALCRYEDATKTMKHSHYFATSHVIEMKSSYHCNKVSIFAFSLFTLRSCVWKISLSRLEQCEHKAKTNTF